MLSKQAQTALLVAAAAAGVADKEAAIAAAEATKTVDKKK